MAEKKMSQLSADIPAIAAKLNKTVETTMKDIGLTLYAEVVSGNPVDTGFSRSNWNMSLAEPNYSVHGTRNPKATYEAQAPSLPENPQLQPVFIANGVDYVKYLEEGHSKQAPSGFIRTAVERVSGRLRLES